MASNIFRGASAEQDSRFSDKQKKLSNAVEQTQREASNAKRQADRAFSPSLPFSPLLTAYPTLRASRRWRA